MAMTKQQVAQVATLARLALSETELEALTGQMGQILHYVEALDALNTDGIEPTAHAVPMENAFRDDALAPSLGVQKALQNAPEANDTAFSVPKVLE